MLKNRAVKDSDSEAASSEAKLQFSINRRSFLASIAGTAVAVGLGKSKAFGQSGSEDGINLAKVAVPTSLTVTSENKIAALNDGFTPTNSLDRQHGTYAVWHDPEEDGPPEWVQYRWSRAIPVSSIEVYWAIDRPRPNAPPGSGYWQLKAPASYRILYWNGSDFVPVPNARGFGLAADKFNTTSFDEVQTDKLRLEIVAEGIHPAGVLEWRVSHTGPVPVLPPVVQAGIDRSVVLGGETYLSGNAIWLQDGPDNAVRWSKLSGPCLLYTSDAAD